MTTVVDNGKLCGLFTDGDLRRTIDQRHDIHATQIKGVMTIGSKTVTPDKLAAEALKIMQDNRISCLVVVDENDRPCAVVHLHALIRAGIA